MNRLPFLKLSTRRVGLLYAVLGAAACSQSPGVGSDAGTDLSNSDIFNPNLDVVTADLPVMNSEVGVSDAMDASPADVVDARSAGDAVLVEGGAADVSDAADAQVLDAVIDAGTTAADVAAADAFDGSSFDVHEGGTADVTDAGAGSSSIYAGYTFHCVIMARSARCWGNVPNMPLTTPSAPLSFGGHAPLSFGASVAHMCVVLDDHTIRCWGSNGSGQLGYGDALDRVGPPATSIDLGPGRTALSVAAGNFHSCALLDDHTVKCWGGVGTSPVSLGYGESVGNRAPPMAVVDLGAGRTAISLHTDNGNGGGFPHTCVILDDHSVKCWGNNYHGVLGYGDTANRATPPTAPVAFGPGRTVIALGMGSTHTCAILDDRSLRCWGHNFNGQLGYGDTTDRTAPSSIAVNLGVGRTAVALVGGTGFTCAILDDHSVRCWGLNNHGQLGYGDAVSRTSPPSSAVNLGAGRTAVALAASYDGVCALLDDNTVKCWGNNVTGQLGYGDTVVRSAPSADPLPL